MNEENQISYYSVIPASVRYDNRLKPAEKLMYGEITSLTNRIVYCYLSIQKADKLILAFPDATELENIDCGIPFLYATYPGLEVINYGN